MNVVADALRPDWRPFDRNTTPSATVQRLRKRLNVGHVERTQADFDDVCDRMAARAEELLVEDAEEDAAIAGELPPGCPIIPLGTMRPEDRDAEQRRMAARAEERARRDEEREARVDTDDDGLDLTAARRAEVRTLRDEDWPIRRIARATGLSRGAVHRMCA